MGERCAIAIPLRLGGIATLPLDTLATRSGLPNLFCPNERVDLLG
jgi:hypothetical protein